MHRVAQSDLKPPGAMLWILHHHNRFVRNGSGMMSGLFGGLAAIGDGVNNIGAGLTGQQPSWARKIPEPETWT